MYELPPSNNNQIRYEPSGQAKKYTVKKDIEIDETGNKVLCLNCNNWVRIGEIDAHCLTHVKIVN